ncbi:uncharacterized protein Pyn_18229 [Prunus yedoensis var. nudiflora]|uniref:Uncharacterized protein n=1 Tax=Prunus yedoensis var. nudiflora TaxID=2094558 RepID=A0A314Z781_PRUYE|nr:uncharacterized protein Pyn_18229 [Prunus yedoensis var. nudiflora]
MGKKIIGAKVIGEKQVFCIAAVDYDGARLVSSRSLPVFGNFGMGTEVQSKMYLPGYYSVQKLSSNVVGHGSWSLLHENKNLKNGQQYELFLTRPIMDGFHGCDKEQMRQTILKHESVFRHQLNELHRLYERQKDLMNEIKSKELLKHKNFGRPCTSSTGISQSPCNSIGKTLQTSGGPSESRVRMKDHESPDSRGKKPRRRLFNLELPADELSVMEKNQKEFSWGQIDKVSTSTSVFKFGNDFRSKEEIKRQVLSANAYKGVWPFAKKFPENPQTGMDGRVSNLHLKNERHQKEWSTNALKAEQTRSFSGGRFGLQDFNKPCESSETEARIVCEPAKFFPSDQNKMEKQRKRTIFGIEIFERDINSSAKPLQSDVTISESSPNWTKPPISLSQNLILAQGNTSLNTSQSDKTSIMLQQSTEVIRDRLLVDCNSIPSTPSLKAEVSHQNGVCFHAKSDTNELQASHPSISLAFPNEDSNCNFANQTDLRKGPNQSPVQDCSSLMHGHDAENWRVEIGDWTKTRKTFALPMFDKFSFPYPCSSSKSGGLASAVDNGYTVRIESAKSNVVQDPVSHMCTVQLKADGPVLEKRLFDVNADSRHQIDLNRCYTEEETEMTAASPIMRTETVIDLEAPVIIESDIDGEHSMQSKCKEPLDLPHEGLLRVAAEALVAISSSQGHDMQNSTAHHLQESATCHETDASENDSLLWFAELISSHEGNIDNDKVAEVKGTACDEDDVIDFFEHMTLNLVETKVEKYCYVPPNQENPREELLLPKRPRRGQARRGRQRKDFQRDVLPSLVSLSRNEVTEDFQLIEGLIRESGGSWQSSLTQRNAGKSGKGRGRKRMGTAAPSTTVAVVSQPQIEEPKCKELQGLEERSLTGWGKRTRRPPRQRFSSPVPKRVSGGSRPVHRDSERH